MISEDDAKLNSRIALQQITVVKEYIRIKEDKLNEAWGRRLAIERIKWAAVVVILIILLIYK